jgi:PAS domain S-box-containing protein
MMPVHAKPEDRAESAGKSLWGPDAPEALCETLLHHSPLMLLRLDSDGIILNVSGFWSEATGYEPDEVVGRPLEEFLFGEIDRSNLTHAWQALLGSDVVKGVPLDLITKGGPTLKVLLSATVQREQTGVARNILALLIDVTGLQGFDKRIQQQERFLEHVLESLPHPFYVLDADNYVIKMANSAARFGRLTSYATCYALTHRRDSPCTEPEHTCPLAVVKRTGKPVTVEHVHYDADGNPRDYEVHGYPVFDEHGKVIQMIEYSLDITERKRMEQELIENAEKTKLFAYSISHDLKSPLIGIHGLVRLLCKRYGEALDDKGRSYCEQILKTSEHAVALVEEINAYIRAKEVALEFETMDPLEVLHMVREEFGALLGVRQIAWVEPKHIPRIRADRKCMLRVFRNLVDNALKYGGDPLTRLEIGYEESDDFHTFLIRDNGVGIRPEDSEKIFGLFQRNETSRGVEGTGLGLAIVKTIVEKHRGQIRLESHPGLHTTFHISLAKDL